MTTLRIMECTICWQRGIKGCRRMVSQSSILQALAPGRVPRIAKLLALAHKFERLVQEGMVADYATLARLGQVSRARITQIMNLLHFAPDIQEDILFLPHTAHGREPIQLRRLQTIAQVLDWSQQRVLWRQLTCEKYRPPLAESSGGRFPVEVTDGGLTQPTPW